MTVIAAVKLKGLWTEREEMKKEVRIGMTRGCGQVEYALDSELV